MTAYQMFRCEFDDLILDLLELCLDSNRSEFTGDILNSPFCVFSLGFCGSLLGVEYEVRTYADPTWMSTY